MAALRPVNLIAPGTTVIAQGGGGELWSVNVNTAAAGGILKIYNDVTAVTPNLVATIDCSAIGSFWYGVYCQRGITAVLSGASPDVTIGVR